MHSETNLCTLLLKPGTSATGFVVFYEPHCYPIRVTELVIVCFEILSPLLKSNCYSTLAEEVFCQCPSVRRIFFVLLCLSLDWCRLISAKVFLWSPFSNEDDGRTTAKQSSPARSPASNESRFFPPISSAVRFQHTVNIGYSNSDGDCQKCYCCRLSQYPMIFSTWRSFSGPKSANCSWLSL